MIVTLARTLIMYIAIIISVRIMGKRQVGELQPSELVVTIMISELAAIPLQDLTRPVVNGLIAIFTLIILELIMSALSLKFNWVRRTVTGRPVVIINHGKIDQKIMRDMRMTLEDLMENLRQQGVFKIEDVNYAIVETNGKLSVLLKPEQQPATASMVGKVAEDTGLRCMVISDGAVQTHSLPFTSLSTQEELRQFLKNKHLDERDIFLLMADQTTDYLIVKRDK